MTSESVQPRPGPGPTWLASASPTVTVTSTRNMSRCSGNRVTDEPDGPALPAWGRLSEPGDNKLQLPSHWQAAAGPKFNLKFERLGGVHWQVIRTLTRDLHRVGPPACVCVCVCVCLRPVTVGCVSVTSMVCLTRACVSDTGMVCI